MHHLDDILGCSLAGTVSKNFFFVSAGNSQPEAASHGAKSEIVVVLSKMTITSDLPLASNSLYSKVWVKKLAHAKPLARRRRRLSLHRSLAEQQEDHFSKFSPPFHL